MRSVPGALKVIANGLTIRLGSGRRYSARESHWGNRGSSWQLPRSGGAVVTAEDDQPAGRIEGVREVVTGVAVAMNVASVRSRMDGSGGS